MIWTDKCKEHVLYFGNREIVVHRHIDFPADKWLLTCRDIRLVQYPLACKDLDAAKHEAVSAVRTRLREALHDLDEACA